MYNKLHIEQAKDLQEFTIEDIYLSRNMGVKALKNLIDILREKGFNPKEIFKPMDKDFIEYPIKINIRELLEGKE
ncbi:hypothetical protein [Inediibacterium massiliense]|uniref:hypothetical protein n=1 Tax=Inediibacterium massiliense TaxID=1658111 RepID=UPI0006B5A013|nr:hypothetical protein [Inediibacterium massiliense]